MYILNNDITYFDNFGLEHIPKEIKTFIGYKNIKTNIFKIQAYDSIMCGYFCIVFFKIQEYDSILCGYSCIVFFDFMLAGKTLTDFPGLFSQDKFKRNDDILLNYFVTNV